jgi:multidrug efflux pump
MRFTDVFLHRPILSLVVSLLIFLIGLRALLNLPVRQYPRTESATITVRTTYPGASPNLVQGFITTPIAQSIATADGVEYLTSESTQGRSTVSARLRLNANSDRAMTEIMAKVNEVKFRIPKDAYDSVITKSTGDPTAVMYIGFASEQLPIPAISDYLLRVVQPLIATVPGVASADILGGQTLAMRVWVDPARLAARGISAGEVADALRRNNVQAAPGQAKGPYTVANIHADTDIVDVEAFRRLVVKAVDGGLVRLGDVATVEFGSQNYERSARQAGRPAVYIGVNATPTGNPLSIVRDVRALLPEIERNLPPGLSVLVDFDVAKYIHAVLIPVVTIPLSLVGAATLMLAFGFSLNLLTLLALVLSIGLVVDDAIVVVENVYRHIEEGQPPVAAALLGAREIAGPVIAMTITLAAVYAPIGFMGGLTGSLFREFAFTLAGAVLVSGVIALTLSPMMASVLLTPSLLEGRFVQLAERGFLRLTRAYASFLRISLDSRPAVLVFGLGILVGLVLLFTGAKRELAPPEDQGSILTAIKGPQYANLDYTEAFNQRLEQVFRSLPEADATFLLNGSDGPSKGFGGVDLVDWKHRTRRAQELQYIIQAGVSQIEGQRIFAFLMPALPGSTGGLPVQMVIRGPSEFEAIYATMERLKEAAQKSGLFIVVDSDLAFNNPAVHMHINRWKANELGITMEAIADTLAVLVGENYVNRFNFRGRSYDVITQAPRADRLSPESLGKYYLKTASGNLLPLSTVVEITTATEPNKLTQFNQLNSATFQAIPAPGVTLGDAVAFLEREARTILPKGFSYDWLGDTRQYVQEGNQLTITFGFALIVIFLVLAAQFESLRDPLVILVSVPLSICGALAPLYLGFATLNIYTQIGLVTLIGLISKHGILMVEFANELQRTEGCNRHIAIERAATVRLRPILMTTAAMVMGLFPLLFANGAGAVSRFSIGIVVIVGMLVGTLFTLFVVPVVYTVVAKDHRAALQSERAKQLTVTAA